MNWRNVKIKTLLCVIMLFLGLIQLTAYGQDNRSNEAVRYFTRDIIVELVCNGDTGEDERLDLKKLSEQLVTFFTHFNYDDLYEPLLALLPDDDRSELSQDFGDAIKSLNQNKEGLFKEIHINSKRYYEFTIKEKYSFATITMDTSNITLSREKQDFMLLVFSVGMTAGGPYYLENDAYTLKGVSLNWMMVGQIMSGMITGGPGGLPIKPAAAIAEKDYAMDASGISSSSQGFFLPEYNKIIQKPIRPIIDPTDVFILDTIPQITDIYEGFVAYEATNEVINSLFSLFGTYHSIQYNTCADHLFSTYINENYGNKNLSDHGTFIAGIIHLLSPDAHLHLIEVMNHYATGTLDSLVWGFQQVLNQVEKGKPFIINSSLTTKLRFPGKNSEKEENIENMTVKMIYGIKKPELSLNILKDVIELVNQQNGVVIAAAGNDSELSDHHEAGYPARFKDVVGVGSTQRNGSISSFSNEPGTDGLMAFGGEVDSSGVTKDGILSIYISSPYTDSTDINSSGWARWAGSSFATGMVSGAMASLLCQGYDNTYALKIVRSSCFTSGGYDVLPIDQGP